MSNCNTTGSGFAVTGFRCPCCRHSSMWVVFTRHRGNITLRTRECHACKHRVRTSERVIEISDPRHYS